MRVRFEHECGCGGADGCAECGLCSTTRYVKAGNTEPNKEDSSQEQKGK